MRFHMYHGCPLALESTANYRGRKRKSCIALKSLFSEHPSQSQSHGQHKLFLLRSLNSLETNRTLRAAFSTYDMESNCAIDADERLASAFFFAATATAHDI